MSGQTTPAVDRQRVGNVNAYVDLVVGGTEDLATVTTVEAWVGRGHGVLKESVELDAEVVDPVERVIRVSYGGPTGWLAAQLENIFQVWYLQLWMRWPDDTGFTFPEKGEPPLKIVIEPRFKPVVAL